MNTLTLLVNTAVFGFAALLVFATFHYVATKTRSVLATLLIVAIFFLLLIWSNNYPNITNVYWAVGATVLWTLGIGLFVGRLLEKRT